MATTLCDILVEQYRDCIKQRRFQEWVNKNYTDPLIFAYDFLNFEEPVNGICTGDKEKIIEALRTIFKPDYGPIEVGEPDCTELPEGSPCILFTIPITTGNGYSWYHEVFWHISDNKIAWAIEGCYPEQKRKLLMIPQFIFKKARKHPQSVRHLLEAEADLLTADSPIETLVSDKVLEVGRR